MQVSVENTGGLERRMTIQVPEDEINQQVDSRLRELGKQVRIKGFRPGRVPMKVIQQRYGRQVRQEIIGQVMQNSFEEALQSEQIRLAGQPRVEPKEGVLEGGDLEYTAIFEVFPELELADIESLTIKRPVAKITEDDVEDMVNTLQSQRMELNSVDRPAKTGDRVMIEYQASADEVTHPEMGRERITVNLGSGQLFEAFEKAIEGLSEDDDKTVTIQFPEDFRAASIAGKKASVDISVLTVQEAELPVVDEEFAKSFGIESGDVDELRREIRSNLERELKAASSSLMKVEVTDRLIEANPGLDVPESMVRDEAQSLQQRDSDRQRQNGVETPEAQPLNLYMDNARRRVKAGMMMGELARQNGIRMDKERVREHIETTAATFEEPQQVVDLYYGNRQLMERVENAVLEEQVVDWVLDNATVDDTSMAFKEVIAKASQHNS